MTANYRHIRFEEIQGFTVCRSNHGGAVLGRVEWHARWKEHEFIPEPDTAYTIECLRDMADFLGKMNAARKANIAGESQTPRGGSHA
jgi:hypothetical protein